MNRIHTNDPAGTVLSDAMESLLANNDPPVLFQRGGRLLHVRSNEQRSLHAVEHNAASLSRRLAKVADFGRETKALTWNSQPPPQEYVRMLLVHDEEEWRDLPVLERVTEVPLFQRDGTLMEEPGYYPTSRTWFAPNSTVRGAAYTDADPDAALEVLHDLFEDFPWESKADWVNTLALMLTPLVWDLIRGLTPLFLVKAREAGAGKTLLTEVALTPTCGSVGLAGASTSEEEIRKTVLAQLLMGKPAIVLDNVAHKLDSATLARMLTAGVYEDRTLGLTDITVVPVRSILVVTANNPDLSTDLLRRSVPIHLSQAKERTEPFRHSNLKQWALDNRSELLAALIALTKHWLEDPHQPVYEGPVLPSYERWCEVVGGILHAAELRQFLTNLDKLKLESSSERDIHLELLDAWGVAIGLNAPTTTAEVLERQFQPQVAQLLTAIGSPRNAYELGNRLAPYNQRRAADGRMIRKVGRKWVLLQT